MFQGDGGVGQINQCFEVNDHLASWQAASWISFIIGCRCCWSRSTANVMALSNLMVNYEKQRWPDRKGEKVHLLDKKYVQKKLSSGRNKLAEVILISNQINDVWQQNPAVQWLVILRKQPKNKIQIDFLGQVASRELSHMTEWVTISILISTSQDISGCWPWTCILYGSIWIRFELRWRR